MGKQNELNYHYICHRSGYYDCKATGKRQIKSQGTCKIDATCTSSIEVIERDNVQAKYYSTHFGHDFFLVRLQLSKSDKDIIAGKKRNFAIILNFSSFINIYLKIYLKY